MLLAQLALAQATEFGAGSETLGIVANADDPISGEIAQIYASLRGVPMRNIAKVKMDSRYDAIGVEQFKTVAQSVKDQLPPHVQFLLLTFTRPFRVECASITSSFAFGFSYELCAEPCGRTKWSRYYDSESRTPYTDLGVRPAMTLGVTNVQNARKLITRGIESDGTFPTGRVYLLDTSDKVRNVRSRTYSAAIDELEKLPKPVASEIVHQDAIRDRADVFMYFIGKSWVEHVNTNRFLPGALADHLTSSGGDLFGVKQMSVLRWLDAGATASYGSVVEPCAFPEKFPNIPVVIRHYLRGESLIEAYWKSVAMPGQGIFVGEPLARPFAAKRH